MGVAPRAVYGRNLNGYLEVEGNGTRSGPRVLVHSKTVIGAVFVGKGIEAIVGREDEQIFTGYPDTEPRSVSFGCKIVSYFNIPESEVRGIVDTKGVQCIVK